MTISYIEQGPVVKSCTILWNLSGCYHQRKSFTIGKDFHCGKMLQRVILFQTHMHSFSRILCQDFSEYTTRGDRQGPERGERTDGWRSVLGGQWTSESYGGVISSPWCTCVPPWPHPVYIYWDRTCLVTIIQKIQSWQGVKGDCHTVTLKSVVDVKVSCHV